MKNACRAAQPPETDPAHVAWARAPFGDGQIDLGAHYSGAYDAVAYARVVLRADRATTLHLAMGSDVDWPCCWAASASSPTTCCEG